MRNRDLQRFRAATAKLFLTFLLGGVFLSGEASEYSDFTKAEKTGTAAAYEAFLKKYPKGALADTVTARLATLKFSEVEHTNTVEAYRAFLAAFPGTRQAAEAKEKIQALRLQPVAGKFAEVERANTVEAYKAFMAEFPDTPWAARAKEKAAALEYEPVEKENTAEAYRKFMAAYPGTRESAVAAQKLRALEYETAKEQNTAAAFRTFLASGNTGSLAEDARQRLKLLDFVEANTQGTEEAWEIFLAAHPLHTLSRRERVAMLSQIPRDSVIYETFAAATQTTTLTDAEEAEAARLMAEVNQLCAEQEPLGGSILGTRTSTSSGLLSRRNPQPATRQALSLDVTTGRMTYLPGSEKAREVRLQDLLSAEVGVLSVDSAPTRDRAANLAEPNRRTSTRDPRFAFPPRHIRIKSASGSDLSLLLNTQEPGRVVVLLNSLIQLYAKKKPGT